MKVGAKIYPITFVGAPQPSPVFDWREQLEDADAIIEMLRLPRPTQIGSRRNKPSDGTDLRSHRESLAMFLAELAESYVHACGDCEMRSDPEKPHRELERNWRDDEPDPGFDYGEDAGIGHDFDWEQHWRETHGRGRGNPGTNRTTTNRTDSRPPIEPLRLTDPSMARWWKQATGRELRPEFVAPAQEGEAAEPFERNNSSARFLILVSQHLDKRFDVANVRGLADTMKKRRRAQRRRVEE